MPSPTLPIPILFCITELDPGGAEKGLVQLATRLDRSRWQPRVISLAGRGSLAEPLEAAGIPVTCLNAKNNRDISLLWKLVREIRLHKPAIVQTFLFHANLLGRVAARLAGVKHVVSGIRVAERRSDWYLRADRWTEFLIDYHVCASQGVLEFSRNHGKLSSKKLVSIPNGVEFEKFETAVPVPREQLGIAQHEMLALYAGRLDPQKGLLDLLLAAEKLKTAAPELRWILAGEGNQRPLLQEQIERRQLSKQVQLLGYRSDIPELMKTSDLFVLPSHWEGLPNVVLEAMSAGLPIVTTRVEGVDELLENNVSGEIVPIGDPVALADSVLRLIKNPELRTRYSHQAYEKVKHNFSWQRCVEQYDQLYQSLLES